MASTKEVKAELGRRVEAVTRPEFLEAEIAPLLRTNGHDNGSWEIDVIQLDGTGAATVEVRLDGSRAVFAKLYPDGNGAKIYEKLRALRAHGFGESAQYQAVEPLGFVPEYDMLLAWEAEGPPVSAAIEGADDSLVKGAEHSGVWLGRLHSAPIRIGRPMTLLESGELLPLARRLSKIMCIHPDFLPTALGMIRTLEQIAENETVEGLLVQSHGQFRPIHVFIGDEAVTVIDLDRSRPSDPARDVAEFVHRLRTTMFSYRGSAEAADQATDAFLEAYAATVPERSYLANLKFHWARYLFHSMNRKLKDDELSEEDMNTIVTFYGSEFDRVVEGSFKERLAAISGA